MPTNLAWPTLPDTPQPADQVRALILQFERTEKMPPAEMLKAQLTQLRALCVYAVKHSKHTAARFKEAGIAPADLTSMEALRLLPLLTRRDLQANIADILTPPPADHTPTGETKTSGSSGEPVRVQRTKISQIFWLAHTMREHLWYKRDFSATLAVIRANAGEKTESDTWGVPASLFVKTGPCSSIPINTPINEQAEWLEKLNPHYLLTYPNNLAALLEYGVTLPRLKEIRSIGETLHADTRAKALKDWGAKIVDTYSSQELGIIATQCPTSGLYHVMAESLIVEVLDAQNKPCKPGETGRVVITDLNNFNTPLIRYDIGDYAEIAKEACPCGRTLPLLKKVAGRERNMIVIKGQRAWPLVGFHRYRDVAPIQQYQVIQKTEDLLEFRYVSSSNLTEEHEEALRKVIQESLRHPFQIEFTPYPDALPKPASGKFEEFVCMVGR